MEVTTMREVVSGIFTWPWFSARHGYNFNGYLVCAAGGNLCIDPVEPDAATLDEIARLGATRIAITNRNHVRAAGAVRARTGARTAIHRDDADHARSQGAALDDQLHVGQRIGPFTVVAVPGKSPGEIALHWPARRLLIAGDAVIGNPPGQCSLLPDKVVDDPARLRASVRGLLELDFDTLLVGDGESILSGAKERLQELVKTFDADQSASRFMSS
jgi:glyoxylase-like metal-dependent hydrolase (beta-lactamase superfamily II)